MPQIIFNVSLLVVSLVFLVHAARKTVDSLINLAQLYQISDALIAMSVVAIGTSLPEIGAHITASAGILSGRLDLEIMSFTVLGGNMGSSTVERILLL